MIIDTERLILRKWTQNDADDINSSCFEKKPFREKQWKRQELMFGKALSFFVQNDIIFLRGNT